MMSINDHDILENWTKKYSGTAILGFLCTLLILGKFFHHIFQLRGLVFGLFIIPPALISGFIGIYIFIQLYI
jgi:hypothetical protein